MSLSFNDLAHRPSRTWSPLQTAIFDDVAEGDGHTVVSARAGSGKTTTIVEALRHVPRDASTLMVAFNKSIERELSSRAPAGVVVRTLHGFGFAAVQKAFGKVPLEEDKCKRIIRSTFGELPRDRVTVLCKGVSLAKATLATDAAEVLDLIDDHDLDVEADQRDGFADVVVQLLTLCGEDQRSVDFDDMVWLPVCLQLQPRRFDRVFIDETQDLNACQVELALAACGEGARICAVGDERQAIYGFRGADMHAMQGLIERLQAKRLALSVTYRCARAIVEAAREVVPDLEAAPGAEEGSVTYASQQTMMKDAAAGDFILSRANAPLVGHCLNFLAEGRPATITGRDIGAGLAALIRRAAAGSVDELVKWVRAWAAAEVARLLEKDKDPGVPLDKAACIERLCEGAKTVDEVLGRLDRLFTDKDDTSRIVLSTTHKAKGLERPRVWILADTYRRRETPEEANLWYVAVTRAKRDLRLVGAA